MKNLGNRFRPVILAAIVGGLLPLYGCSQGGGDTAGADSSAVDASVDALSTGVNGGDSASSPPGSTAPEAKQEGEGVAAARYVANTRPKMPRKIIHTAQIDLVAGDLEAARRELGRRVKAHGGYLADTSLSGTTGESREGTWTVRIPADRYETFVEEVSRLGEVTSLRTDSQDVSEEFYDVQARLKAKRLEEARLLKHLDRSTTRLTDILAVEREISRVHSEIEQMEGRLRFLADQTDLTTVTVTIHEAKGYVPPAPETFGTQVSRTFGESTRTLMDTGKGLLLAFIALLPWLVVLALPLAFLVNRLIKWRRASVSPAISE